MVNPGPESTGPQGCSPPQPPSPGKGTLRRGHGPGQKGGRVVKRRGRVCFSPGASEDRLKGKGGIEGKREGGHLTMGSITGVLRAASKARETSGGLGEGPE